MICFLVKHKTTLYVFKDSCHVTPSTVGWCKLVSIVEELFHLHLGKVKVTRDRPRWLKGFRVG